MTALEKLFLLVNMLYTRRSVSVGTIMHDCSVSRRTVFRYIRTLSEANVPVYYDKDVRGYRSALLLGPFCAKRA